MKAHVTNVSLVEQAINKGNELRIDFSNDYHIAILVNGFSPESLANAFQKAAHYILKADHNGKFEVQS